MNRDAALPTGTVTFLFTDLEGSTRLWEEFPDAMQGALARHDAILRDAIASHDGHIVKTTGDGVHAAFATAHHAVDAAVAAQRTLADSEWDTTGPLKVRMGLHTCEAELRDGDYYGSAVNRAARLMSAAHGGQIVLSMATSELVRESDVELVDLGEHRLRDLARGERVFQVAAPDLAVEFPPLQSLDAFPGNLPLQLTSFVGRDDELRSVAKAFDEWRLVTLTGSGGVGKTRLAIQVAAELLPEFLDGAWLCELATADAPDVMIQVVAAALGVSQRVGMALDESIVDYLRSRRLLVVLDNCEHLLDAASDLAAAILRASPGVRILATSREALDVDGERVMRVRSLPLPAETTNFDTLAESDAVRLFTERADAAASGFTLTPGNAEAVAEICRRLDGIPLAVELAAARIIAMRPPEIAALLNERFRLLTGGRRSAVERHQTLRATVDWSYSLLTESERDVFDRLGVFVGSFDARAATAVAAGDHLESWDVLDALASLVAKSMIVDEEADDGTTRYRLLETMRQYAREQLDERGQSDERRRVHARHYASVTKDLGREIFGPDELNVRARINVEFDNVRAAMEWALDRGDPAEQEYALEIVAALGNVITRDPTVAVGGWITRTEEIARRASTDLGRMVLAYISTWYANFRADAEATRPLALEAVSHGVPPQYPGVASAYVALSIIEMQSGRIREARQWVDDGARALEAINERGVHRSGTLNGVAAWALLDGDIEAARAASQESLTIARRVGSPTLIANALFIRGEVEGRDDPPAALAAFEEAAELMRAGADITNLGGTLAGVARQRESAGDVGGALEALVEVVAHFSRAGKSTDLLRPMAQISRLLAALGRHEAAATIAGVLIDGALASLAFAGTPERMHRSLATTREALGPERYDAAVARGAALSFDDATAFARVELDQLIEETTSRG